MLLTMPSRNSSHHGYVNSRTRRAVLAAIAAVTMTLLVGSCSSAEEMETGLGEGAEPVSAGSETPEPVATAEEEKLPAGIAAPTRPDAIKQNDLESAAVSAKYFLELYGYTIKSLDLSEFRAISSPDCEFCNDFIGHISELVEGEQAYEGGALKISEAVHDETENTNDIANVLFYMEQKEAKILDSGGDVVEAYPAGSMGTRVVLTFEDESWTVTQVEVEEETQ